MDSAAEDCQHKPEGSAGEPLVSVIIPCYNQARFLPDAIRSVLGQSYRHFEIIVVNDGSSDDTELVAGSFAGVRCITQSNRGLAAARNTGTRESTGLYVVYLDADDVLFKDALEIGCRYLSGRPECAFVSGAYTLVDSQLRPLYTFRSRPVRTDHYLALLRSNYIGMCATVVFRREVVTRVGGFDESLRACEDYDLYLRIARHNRVFCHGEIVAGYRQHASSMSADPELMLRSVLKVHGNEAQYVKGESSRETAYAEGRRILREYYAGRMLGQLARSLPQAGRMDVRDLRRVAFALRHYPTLNRTGKLASEWFGKLKRRTRAWVRRSALRPHFGRVRFGSFSSIAPIGQGLPKSESIETFYENAFLQQHEQDNRGEILELEIGGAAIENLPQFDPNRYDCVLCLRQLQNVLHLPAAISEMRRILKPGGVVLASLPGVVSRSGGREDGSEKDYWRFTKLSARTHFARVFGEKNVTLELHGNVLAGIGALHNIPASHFTMEELRYADPQQQLLITVRAVKRGEAATDS